MLNKRFLFILIFLLLLFSTVYSYSRVEWQIENGVYSLIGVTNMITTIPKYLALLIGLYLCFSDRKVCWIVTSHRSVLLLCVLLALFWFAESIVSGGFVDALYAANTPLVLTSLLFVIFGTKEQYWYSLLKIAPYFSIVYVGFMLSNNYAFGQILNARLAGNNPITTYLVSSFWWISVMSLRFRDSSFIYKVLFVCLLSSVTYVAFIHTFRSWMIQSILLLVGTLYVGINGSKKNKYLIPLLIVTVILIILPNFLESDIGIESIDKIIRKSENDTRGYQYEEIFGQLGISDWIMGGGLYATYYSQTAGGGMYSYIDSQYLMVLFHFGIFMFITYFGLWLKTSFMWLTRLKCVPKIDSMPLIVLCLWMSALGGLSVYNALVFSPQMLIMPIILGKSMNILHSKNIIV